MLKEFLKEKKNLIVLAAVAAGLLLLMIILCIVFQNSRAEEETYGTKYDLVKKFGKSAGFPGRVFAGNNGEIKILIENDTDTFFVCTESSSAVAVTVDICFEDDKDYQQFRAERNVNLSLEEAKNEEPLGFTIVNIPKNLAYKVNVALTENGGIRFLDIKEDKNYQSELE